MPDHSLQVRGGAVGVVVGEALWRVPVTLLPLPAGSRPDTVTLRSAKSEESLSSQASGAGEHGVAHVMPGWGWERLGRALSWPPSGVLRFGGVLVCF